MFIIVIIVFECIIVVFLKRFCFSLSLSLWIVFYTPESINWNILQ